MIPTLVHADRLGDLDRLARVCSHTEGEALGEEAELALGGVPQGQAVGALVEQVEIGGCGSRVELAYLGVDDVVEAGQEVEQKLALEELRERLNQERHRLLAEPPQPLGKALTGVVGRAGDDGDLGADDGDLGGNDDGDLGGNDDGDLTGNDDGDLTGNDDGALTGNDDGDLDNY